MSARVQLPVWQSVKLAFQWGWFVIASHWRMFTGLVLVGFAIQSFTMLLPSWWAYLTPMSALAFVIYVVFSLALIATVLLSHNEVLRGASDLDASTVGRGGSRIFGYLLDLIAMFLMVMLAMVAVMLGITLVVILIQAIGLPQGLVAVFLSVLYLAGMLAYLGVFARLMLRLPSRALGQPLPWHQVWTLGRGNTFRLIGANVLLFLAFLVPIAIILLAGASVFPFKDLLAQVQIKHVPGEVPFFTGLPFGLTMLFAGLNALLTPLEFIVFAAFYSVAYAQLIQNRPEEPEGLVSA